MIGPDSDARHIVWLKLQTDDHHILRRVEASRELRAISVPIPVAPSRRLITNALPASPAAHAEEREEVMPSKIEESHRSAVLRGIEEGRIRTPGAIAWAYDASPKALAAFLALSPPTMVTASIGVSADAVTLRAALRAISDNKANAAAPDPESIDRLAWLTSTDETDPKKASSKLAKRIAKDAKAKADDVLGRRMSPHDFAANARRAGVSSEQFSKALKAKGWVEKDDEHGRGWQMPAEKDG